MSFSIKDILRLQVAPALGCTEPVAIALSTAAAASLLKGKEPEAIEVWVDRSIYKNGMSVLIPGTGGLFGLDLAAALGALGGDPSLKLQVLDPINDETVKRARNLIDQGKVSVHLLDDIGLHIKSLITYKDEKAESEIIKNHDNISSLHLNGEALTDHPLVGNYSIPQGASLDVFEKWLANLTLVDMLNFLGTMDDEDFKYVEQGATLNCRLAEYGLAYSPGLGVGKSLERLVRQKLLKKDMVLAARILTSAAADARMGGIKLPAMSSAGSGNHGLTAVLPIWGAKDYLECDYEEVLKAIALSHIVTAHIKAHTGRLSAICGCSVAAGAGATAGFAYLLGGTPIHISGAINNLIEDLAGVICDGAKLGCSFKLATAAGTAIQSALLALQGINVSQVDGIIDTSVEGTVQNLGALSTEGMIEADRTILNILMRKYSARVDKRNDG